jgi:hypothetical protein
MRFVMASVSEAIQRLARSRIASSLSLLAITTLTPTETHHDLEHDAKKARPGLDPGWKPSKKIMLQRNT